MVRASSGASDNRVEGNRNLFKSISPLDKSRQLPCARQVPHPRGLTAEAWSFALTRPLAAPAGELAVQREPSIHEDAGH
jgi:hypothetical protein